MGGIDGGSACSPSGERTDSPASWITARNISNGIPLSLTGIQQERGRSATRRNLLLDGWLQLDRAFFRIRSSRAKMSQEGEDQGVDTPGQEPRQGQWTLS